MATKTFKIGLSATDKQNMAQDILEQVENMLFEEYDSTKTYNIGDYCVYSGALYRCKVDNTTGTWNSSNWDSATLQDLVDDVNDAVASVNGKANIIDLENGTLVVAKSLTAKQLENVSDESGSTQDAPFNFQATGTDNNTTETPTAPIAKHLELRGNTVAWNQLCVIPTIETTTENGITITNNNDGSVSISGTASADTTFVLMGNLSRNVPLGHYILMTNFANASDSTFYVYDGYESNLTAAQHNSKYGYIKQKEGSTTTISPRIFIKNGTVISTPQKVYVMYFDLTLLGKEYDSALAFNRDYPLPYYSYNAGELKSASSGKLITIGCNAFDGELQIGDLDGGSNPYNCKTKNFIPVIMGQDYIFESGSLSSTTINGFYVYYYDKNFNKVGDYTKYSVLGSTVITIPSNNVCYAKFFIYLVGANFTNNLPTNFMFRLYWNEAHDFVEYVKHEYDLPAVSLKSAGNAYDELKADGTLITRIKYKNDLVFSYYGAYGSGNLVYVSLADAKTPTANELANITINKGYTQVSSNELQTNKADKTFALLTNNQLWIIDSALSSASDLTNFEITYELATPTETTDETKAFTENIEVDDFGTMEFVPASGNVESASNPIVPQGNQFFYPADYVLLIDDLNNYLNENEADTTDLVLRKELLPKLASNSEDGTYTLKATKSGSTITYAWVKDE